MKRRIDLEKADGAEVFGALAVGADGKHRRAGVAGRGFTPAQTRALSGLVRSLVQVAREAGAEERRVTVGGVSLELRGDGIDEILSIRTPTSS
jgi:methylmalonyl-CoA mutase cobalamin-binding subunit